MQVMRRLLVAAVWMGLSLGTLGAYGDEPHADAAPRVVRSPLPARSPAPEPSASPGARPAGLPASGAIAVPAPLTLGGPAPAVAYAAFGKDAKRLGGAIDILRKDDDLYLDLRPENFHQTYIVSPAVASGVGSGAFAGRVYEPFLLTFKRVGKRILWISPNTRYVAPAGSAAAKSLDVSVGDAVLYSSPIVAEDGGGEHTVIAPSLLLTDFEGIGSDLGRAVTPPSLPGLLVISLHAGFGVDASKTYYGVAKAFPRNDEISVNLTFSGPPNALPTVPDGRGIPVALRYSILTADDTRAYMPRLADDRVGYFVTARKVYGDDALPTPFERFIDRWDLTRGPIVFYLTGEIPAQYRATVRRGILAWNDAFTRIGLHPPIVVKDAPADGTFDPDDARWTVVRWITSDHPDFAAYSPTVVDPRDGRIVRGEIVIDGESLRAIKRGYVDRIEPVRRLAQTLTPPADQDAPRYDRTCDIAGASQAQAALGTMVLALHGRGSAADRERFAQAWLFSTVMHETGHTLGLRHNFAGSTAYTLAQLHDRRFTAAHGTTASVMDYTGINLSPPGTPQGQLFPTRLGVYDEWAIAYGYTRFAAVHDPREELPYLRRIADRSTQPGLAYGTDEDVSGPQAIDPRIARFDLSRDPLAYAAQMLAIDARVTAVLDKPYPGDTRSYDEIRASLVTALNNRLSSLAIAAHYLGGIETSRAHRGQRGAPPPFAAVPRAQQQRAFRLIDRYAFSSHAFALPPTLLNELSPSRYGEDWDGGGSTRRPDFPLREVVAEIQDDAIAALFSPPNLARIADQSLKAAPGRTISLADLFGWTNAAIFDDLGRPTIAPTHRELQRRFADLEIAIALLPSFALDSLGVPRETQALARYALRGLDRRIAVAQRHSRDVATLAHLDDLHARIRGALTAQTVRPQ